MDVLGSTVVKRTAGSTVVKRTALRKFSGKTIFSQKYLHNTYDKAFMMLGHSSSFRLTDNRDAYSITLLCSERRSKSMYSVWISS